jgi:hypothetical protein
MWAFVWFNTNLSNLCQLFGHDSIFPPNAGKSAAAKTSAK